MSQREPQLLKLSEHPSGFTLAEYPHLNGSLGCHTGSLRGLSYHMVWAGRGFSLPERLVQALDHHQWRPDVVYAQAANHFLQLYPCDL